MPNIIISGSFQEILAKLTRMKAAISYRVQVGYVKYQHDEDWQYLTAQDERVCEDCGPRHGSIYRGDYLVTDFQMYVSVGKDKAEIHDHTKCRCTAKWLNLHEVIIERLAGELEAA